MITQTSRVAWNNLKNDKEVGKVSDRVLAARHKCSNSLVRRFRYCHDIPSFDGKKWHYRKKAKELAKRGDLSQWKVKELAKELGVSTDVVVVARHFAGLRGTFKPKVSWVSISQQEREILERCIEFEKLFMAWPVLPERRGLTRNEWRKRCALM